VTAAVTKSTKTTPEHQIHAYATSTQFGTFGTPAHPAKWRVHTPASGVCRSLQEHDWQAIEEEIPGEVMLSHALLSYSHDQQYALVGHRSANAWGICHGQNLTSA
jgi:hypothetical protein